MSQNHLVLSHSALPSLSCLICGVLRFILTCKKKNISAYIFFSFARCRIAHFPHAGFFWGEKSYVCLPSFFVPLRVVPIFFYFIRKCSSCDFIIIFLFTQFLFTFLSLSNCIHLHIIHVFTMVGVAVWSPHTLSLLQISFFFILGNLTLVFDCVLFHDVTKLLKMNEKDWIVWKMGLRERVRRLWEVEGASRRRWWKGHSNEQTFLATKWMLLAMKLTFLATMQTSLATKLTFLATS